MTSPYRVLQVAKEILEKREFCQYDDPRYPDIYGYARTSSGASTDPVNNAARQFTLMGALARASFDLSGNWISGHGGACYDIALDKLQSKVSYTNLAFYRHCDKLGKEGCIKLIEEVLE